MEKQYIDKYAEQFKLKKSGNKFLNSRYEHVLSIVGSKVFYKLNENNWKTCKESDLLVSIINNIPLHTD
jgi:hypothetical protein